MAKRQSKQPTWTDAKQTIDRWLWPDVFRNQDTSVSKAKQAISDYKKAVGEPEGMVELMVFYCERSAGFCNDVGNQDEGYFDAAGGWFTFAFLSRRDVPASDMRRKAQVSGASDGVEDAV